MSSAQSVPSAEVVRGALGSVLRGLAPAALMLPEAVLRTLPPRPDGYPPTRELFSGETGPVLDALAPAGAAADLVVQLLLDGDRAARLVEQHALDPGQPSLTEVTGRLLEVAFGAPASSGYAAEVNRVVERAVANGLLRLAATARSAQVRAEAVDQVRQLWARLERGAGGLPPPERANRTMLAAELGRWLDRRWEPEALPKPVTAPPGMPIGDGAPGR